MQNKQDITDYTVCDVIYIGHNPRTALRLFGVGVVSPNCAALVRGWRCLPELRCACSGL
jgi:hypothetical protein